MTIPTYGFLSGWETAALAALLLSFVIVALGFALAIGFKLKELEEWTKQEFYEAMTSGLIILILAFAVTFLNNLSNALAGGDPFALAQAYTDSVSVDLGMILAGIFSYQYVITSLSTLSIAIFFPIPIPASPPPFPFWLMIRSGSFWSIFAGLSAISNGMYNMIFLVAASLFAIISQRVVLDFFHASMLTAFLPLGVLFRAIPITRQAGSTLIAIAIGAYMIYPLTLVMDKYIYDSYSADFHANTVSLEANAFIDAIFKTLLKIATGGFIIEAIWTPFEIPTLVAVLTPLIKNFVIISFLFVIDVIIVITFIVNFSDSLGGDEQVFGLSKLI